MAARSESRRGFLRGGLRGLGGALLAGAVWARWLQSESRAAPFALRPPGAVAEADFLAQCIKCGQCVQACPFDTLRLADLGDEIPLGTPFFVPREVPCYLCEDLPCVGACPSGALSPSVQDPAESRMGLAVLVDHETCLSYNGLRCEICFRQCPLTGTAITIENQARGRSRHALFLPQVHSEACTGCGVCEKVCPLDEAAIRVLPTELAQGKIGGHYELGTENPGPRGGFAEPDESRPGAAMDYLNSTGAEVEP